LTPTQSVIVRATSDERRATPPIHLRDVGLTTTRIEVFVEDPDRFIDRAAGAGATQVEAPTDHETPWGNHRQGGFTDPFGHRWSVGDRSPLAPFGT
jgi:PhnB protein